MSEPEFPRKIHVEFKSFLLGAFSSAVAGHPEMRLVVMVPWGTFRGDVHADGLLVDSVTERIQSAVQRFQDQTDKRLPEPVIRGDYVIELYDAEFASLGDPKNVYHFDRIFVFASDITAFTVEHHRAASDEPPQDSNCLT